MTQCRFLTLRYHSCRADDGDLRSRLRELAQQRRRLGYRRLSGLADYAEKHGANFGRIEAVAKPDENVLALDLKVQVVRDLVRKVATSKEAYRSKLSTPYG